MEDSRGFSGDDEKMPSYGLTSDQRVQLEAFFERCPHPDETQGDQIAKELGLEPKQIKHSFQNKRTKMSQPESQAPGQAFVSSHWMEVEQIAEVADAAMAEFYKLIIMNEPLWDKSSTGGGYVLVRETYASMFPRVDSFNGPHTSEESSKHHKVVRIEARQLVDMLLHSEEWVNIFPTIVSKSETVKLLDVGSLDDRTGALQVVYEEMHALSYLVPSRKLFFLRCCQQVKDGVWAIAHVSIDSFGEHVPDLPARRLPSGCMIYQMNKEFSMVVWVEHVEVKDRMQTSTQRSVISNNVAYGAERWLLALHRMCERLASTSIENMHLQPSEKVVNSLNARKKAMRLSDRMIKDFCRVLYKLSKGVFAKSSEKNNNEIKITLRNNTKPNMPQGIIATAVSGIRLPLPPQNIVNFLTDAKYRSKWDVLSCGFPANEIAHFAFGGNRISIFKTSNRIESNVMVFQDSYTDPLGSYVVYAPISVENACMIMKGQDSMVPTILPSGFLISEDSGTVAEASNVQHATSNRSGGSLLIMAYQLLIGNNKGPLLDQNKETVARIVVSILQRIKTSLNISDD